MMVEIKRLIVSLVVFPCVNFTSKIETIRIFKSELPVFLFFDNKRNIMVNDCCLNEFYIVLFFNDDITDDEISAIENKCKNRLIDYFTEKINDYNDYISEIKKHI